MDPGDSTAVPVSALRPGQQVDGVFACSRKDRLFTRTGAPYLALELRDRSGTIQARAFRDADVLAGRFERGELVRVSGRVERFRDQPVLEVVDIARVEADADGSGSEAEIRRGSCRPPTATSTSSTASSSTSPARSTTAAYRALLDALLADADAARGVAARAVHARRPPRLPRRAARAHGRGGDARATRSASCTRA